MGIDISAKNNDPHIGEVVIVLTCDSGEPFIFCRGSESFEHPEGFIAIHGEAIKAGWLERQGPQGRTWLCPACSGKT